MFLDRAEYFYTRDLWEFVSGERETETVGDSSVSCVHGEELAALAMQALVLRGEFRNTIVILEPFVD